MNTTQSPQAGQHPQKFGRYTITRLLGEGGMGKVYLADDPVLDRKVALKVTSIDPDLDSQVREEFLKMSVVEAKASAKLDHPSIVQVYDAGEQNGQTWIAFQYVQGETVESILKRRGKLPVKRAIAFAIDIASALQCAHSWSIVHRDVKPANILVESSTGIAKLSDFGIVKAPWVNRDEEITVGSPGYMSPEQINGGDLDGRADLFSLGAVLYEMITGINPFKRSTYENTIFATLKGEYRPLSELIPDIPTPLDWVIRRSLEVDRDKRLPATEIIKMLKNALPDKIAPHSEQKTEVILDADKRGQPTQRHSVVALEKTVQDTMSFVSKSIKNIQEFFVQMVSGEPSKYKAVLVGGIILTLSMVTILMVVLIKNSDSSMPRKDSVEARLDSRCRTALETHNRAQAMDVMERLNAMEKLTPYSHILLALVLIRDINYGAAAEHLTAARSSGSGKKIMEKELPLVLDEIGTQLSRGPGSPTLIDMVVNTLDAGDNPQVVSWVQHGNYWLRKNAADIVRKAGVANEE
jgi:serine/threonine protein kinase